MFFSFSQSNVMATIGDEHNVGRTLQSARVRLWYAAE